jgi:hypothetical protein
MERITISYENSEGMKVSSTFEVKELNTHDELFWCWFYDVWPTIGLPSIKKDLEKLS